MAEAKQTSTLQTSATRNCNAGETNLTVHRAAGVTCLIKIKA